MLKFRKLPVVIEAEQWFPGVKIEGVEQIDYDGAPMGVIHTLEDLKDTVHYGSPGDWVIIGVEGERYFCKPNIFTATYEPVPVVLKDES